MMNLVKSEECTGCGVCVKVCKKNAISMKKNSEGFSEPIIDTDVCIKCGQCIKKCPMNNQIELSNYDQMVFAAQNIDIDIIQDSTSGGVFYPLAEFILSKNGVIYGAAWVDGLRVVHIRIDNIKDLHMIMKSKYVQSDISMIYDKIENDLKQGRNILFSGTPCQVAAVKQLFKNYGDKICYVDVVCHGVPSPKIFEEYIQFLKHRYKKINAYCFRKKIPHLGSYVNVIYSENRGYIRNWRELSYAYLFMMGYISRESCYKCKYACKNRIGDITLGDYWGVNEFHPTFNNDSGASLVLINSQRGEVLFNCIKKSLKIEKSSYENASKYNEQIVRPAKRPCERNYILKEWKNNGYNYLYCFYKRCVKGLWKDKLKRILILFVKNEKRN